MTSGSNSRSMARFACGIIGLAALSALVVPLQPVEAAEDVTAEISIKDHRFEPAELKVPASKAIKLTVKNLDASGEEFESKALGVEKVIAGNSTAVVRIKPLAPGKYNFVGEYHEDTAKGALVAE